jgi:SAM-dependent methyltransferase
MDIRELVACPACGGTLSVEWSCTGCATRFDVADGIPNLRLPSDGVTETVRRFYESAPFPGYPPRESLQSLRARAERSVFARLLDRAIAGDARIADVGCGTGQMCLFLASADRIVVGADLTRTSLALGAAAAARFGLERVQFVETDLRQPGPGAASSTLCTRPASCTTPGTRARRSAHWSSWHVRAVSWCSVSTTRLHGFPRG